MTRLHDNIILLTDSYKLSHYKQYPPTTEKIYSYFESRVGAKYNRTIFFGLQYLLKRHLEGVVVTREKIEQAANVASLHMGGTEGTFNREGWEYILEKHNGKLPIRICAVPEGTPVDVSNVMMTIENTDPRCYWLPNYLETLLVQVWYPSTVATVSNYVRQIILDGLIKTGTPELVDFKLHDFGFRGVSSVESAGLGGLAHLVNFAGTDTIAALGCGMEYYDSGVCGFSIPASEHSTITAWGKDHESSAYRNMLEKYPTGLVACVSDSFDIDNACSELWGKELRDKVISRDGVLVVRPDSGDIVPMVLNVLERLGRAFGIYKNDKGFMVLNDKVRVIQGDGCTPETIEQIVNAMITTGWSIDNIAFGMGGGLLQKVNRDTQRFAFKCSAIQDNGIWRDVYKKPVSDLTKSSKGGRVILVEEKDTGNLVTIKREDFSSHGLKHAMRVVFENGEIISLTTLDKVKERARQRVTAEVL